MRSRSCDKNFNHSIIFSFATKKYDNNRLMFSTAQICEIRLLHLLNRTDPCSVDKVDIRPPERESETLRGWNPLRSWIRMNANEVRHSCCDTAIFRYHAGWGSVCHRYIFHLAAEMTDVSVSAPLTCNSGAPEGKRACIYAKWVPKCKNNPQQFNIQGLRSVSSSVSFWNFSRFFTSGWKVVSSNHPSIHYP